MNLARTNLNPTVFSFIIISRLSVSFFPQCMEEEVARSFLGTRGYLAPEMLQRRDYTRAVDAWALGVIVFVLLCGCLPFDDDSQTVPSDDLVRAKFVLRFPRWAKNLSESAKDLLSHLLDVNPITRYSAEMAIDHPWVKGTTAPKESLLASPGRIKKSPVIRKVANGGTPTSARSRAAGGANGRYQPPNRGQPSPVTKVNAAQRLHVRKSSI
jgi:serine/threonine protein kinase